jgi:O-antigen/teichoic acid export membrane protein
MSIFKRLVTNTLSLYTARFYEVLLQLGVLAFILSKMGRESYGAALLIISIQETIDLIRSGFGKATIKYLAEYSARNDYQGTQQIFSTATAIHAFIGILGLLACLIISPFSTSIFSIPGELMAEAQTGTIIMGAGIFVSFIFLPWRHILLAHERYDLSSLARVIARSVNAMAMIIVYYLFNRMIVSILLGTVVGNFCEVMLCRWMAHRLNLDFRLSFSSFSRTTMGMIGRYAFYDILHPVANIFYKNGSFFLCAHMISLSAVAGLGIIFNICRLLSYLINEVAQTVVPITSRLMSIGEQDKIQKVLINTTTVAVCLGGFVLVGMVPLMDSFLTLWLGTTYVYLTNVAIMLLIAESLRSSVSYIHGVLSGTGYVRFDGLSDFVGTITGIAVGVLLVSFFEMGFMGYVVGLCCVNLFRFITITVYGAKVFHINMLKLFWLGHLRVYAIVALFITAGLFLKVHAHFWVTLLLAGGLPSGLFLIACFYAVIDAPDQKRLKEFASVNIKMIRQKYVG